MACHGEYQYITSENLLRSLDFMVTFYGTQEEKKGWIDSIWDRGYETTNGYGDDPESTDFPFHEGCPQHIGWKEYKHTDFKGNLYYTREPKFRPPSKEELEHWEENFIPKT